jgi:twinkle protein
MNGPNWISDDDIDFAVFMDMTDHDHKVRSAKEYADEVVAHFWDESAPKGSKTTFPSLNDRLRFRPHEVTIWAGFNGHGKSLLLGQSVIGFAMQGERTCIASLEMRPVTTLSRMARQASQTNKPDADFLREFCDVLGDGLYLYDQQGMVQSDKIIGVIRYAAEKKGCKHFVVDSLMKCGIGEDDYNNQKRFVDQLCTVARDTGIHVHLVAHSRKQKDELSPPSKMDIRGGASISDQVDNVVIVWRNKVKEDGIANNKPVHAEPDAYLMVQKQRNGEWEGAIPLWFDKSSQQFNTADQKTSNLLSPGLYA